MWNISIIATGKNVGLATIQEEAFVIASMFDSAVSIEYEEQK